MNVRQFIDAHAGYLHLDLAKRTAADAIKEEDLKLMKTAAGWIAFDSKTGCTFRAKKTPAQNSF